MDYKRTLREPVGFINAQTRETDLEMERLRRREPEIDAMPLPDRLECLEAVAEARGKIELLQGIKDYYDSIASGVISIN